MLAALGASTSMTVRMYADRRTWTLRDVQVRLRLEQGGEPVVVHLDADLDDDRRRG
ncbi:hypothetical protein GCM10022206_85770 [Streptomyces chiangmaiensis]